MTDSPGTVSVGSMTRREALAAVGTSFVAAGRFATGAEPKIGTRSALGLVTFDFAIRRAWLRHRDPAFDLYEPLTFLRHCREVGAGGMQASLGVLDGPRIRELRNFADEHQLFIDGIVSPPRDAADLARFEAEIETAAQVGVQAVRTVVMPGRRYEQFKSLTDFREAEGRALRMLELAVPIVTRHRVRLAVENHKDQRIDERVALYKRLSCEFIGATVDTGNSFALLDDPYGAVEALAPFAFSVHLKDQALRENDRGFLLGDIPLGQGSFDLKRITAILRQAKPQLRMCLELITRDALEVPCLGEQYWTTMSHVSGGDLARSLRFVREHPAQQIQQVGSMPLEKQVELEEANVAASLTFAREELEL